jgi:hypothetical protein
LELYSRSNLCHVPVEQLLAPSNRSGTRVNFAALILLDTLLFASQLSPVCRARADVEVLRRHRENENMDRRMYWAPRWVYVGALCRAASTVVMVDPFTKASIADASATYCFPRLPTLASPGPSPSPSTPTSSWGPEMLPRQSPVSGQPTKTRGAKWGWAPEATPEGCVGTTTVIIDIGHDTVGTFLVQKHLCRLPSYTTSPIPSRSLASPCPLPPFNPHDFHLLVKVKVGPFVCRVLH